MTGSRCVDVLFCRAGPALKGCHKASSAIALCLLLCRSDLIKVCKSSLPSSYVGIACCDVSSLFMTLEKILLNVYFNLHGASIN